MLPPSDRCFPPGAIWFVNWVLWSGWWNLHSKFSSWPRLFITIQVVLLSSWVPPAYASIGQATLLPSSVSFFLLLRDRSSFRFDSKSWFWFSDRRDISFGTRNLDFWSCRYYCSNWLLSLWSQIIFTEWLSRTNVNRVRLLRRENLSIWFECKNNWVQFPHQIWELSWDWLSIWGQLSKWACYKSNLQKRRESS